MIFCCQYHLINYLPPDTSEAASDTACHQALVSDTNAILDQSKTSISGINLNQDSLVLESQVSGLEQAESPDVNKEVERAFENSSGHGEFYKCFFWIFRVREVAKEVPVSRYWRLWMIPIDPKWLRRSLMLIFDQFGNFIFYTSNLFNYLST